MLNATNRKIIRLFSSALAEHDQSCHRFRETLSEIDSLLWNDEARRTTCNRKAYKHKTLKRAYRQIVAVQSRSQDERSFNLTACDLFRTALCVFFKRTAPTFSSSRISSPGDILSQRAQKMRRRDTRSVSHTDPSDQLSDDYKILQLVLLIAP